ncbi:hypothetical protein ACWDOM_28755, partial [Streptomyces prasinus]
PPAPHPQQPHPPHTLPPPAALPHCAPGPPLDLVVAPPAAAGALGARMTGGGFGGSAIVLAEETDVDAVTEAVENAFAAAGFKTPRVFGAVPSAGARRVR